MRKVLLFLVLGFALVACSEDKGCEPGVVETEKLSSGSTALKVCDDYGRWIYTLID